MAVFWQPDLDKVIAIISLCYVGQMKVLSVGRHWAITLLLCGMDPPLTYWFLKMGLKSAINLLLPFRERWKKPQTKATSMWLLVEGTIRHVQAA